MVIIEQNGADASQQHRLVQGNDNYLIKQHIQPLPKMAIRVLRSSKHDSFCLLGQMNDIQCYWGSSKGNIAFCNIFH